MPAHARRIGFPCQWDACNTLATHEVRNTYNAPLGKFCESHAVRRVAELRVEEDRERERRRERGDL